MNVKNPNYIVLINFHEGIVSCSCTISLTDLEEVHQFGVYRSLKFDS